MIVIIEGQSKDIQKLENKISNIKEKELEENKDGRIRDLEADV